MEQIITMVLLWLLLGLFLVWRLRRCARRLQVVVWEISYVVFYLIGTPVILVSRLLPDLSRGADMVIVAAYILVSAFVSYKLNGKYTQWRDEQLKKKKDQERADHR